VKSAQAVGTGTELLQRQVEPWDEYVYVCQKSGCSRFFAPWMTDVYTFEEQENWLVAPHREDNDVLVVRCPQHISETALRNSIGFNQSTREWSRQAAEEDAPRNETWSPLTPYPLDPRLLFGDDGRLAVRLTGRNKKVLKRAKDAIHDGHREV